MLRRSARLQSSGYYNSEGVPTISYKEYSYRFKKRRSSRPAHFGTYYRPEPIPYAYSDAETIPYAYSDAETIPYADSDAETIPYADFDAETIPYADSDAETIPYADSEMESEAAPVSRTGYFLNTVLSFLGLQWILQRNKK